MIDWENFHFLRPLWLLALLALPVLIRLLQRSGNTHTPWRRVCDEQLLPHVLAQDASDENQRQWLIPIVISACVLATLALAGPAWKRLPLPVYQDLSALIIMLDLSRSMDAQDIRPSRLARARFKVADILTRRETGMTALVVYAEDAYGVVPLTDDAATIASQLPVLESGLMPAQGSRPERAVSKAIELLTQSGVRRGDLLLVTDALTDAQSGQISEMLRGGSYRLSVLGAGTVDGAPIPRSGGGFQTDAAGKPLLSRLDDSVMRALALQSGGIARTISSGDTDVDALSRLFSTRIGSTSAKKMEMTSGQWREEGPWLLLPLLPLAALLFRRGVIALVFIACLPWPGPAAAASWSDLWQRPDQEGAAALARGDAHAAAERFSDPRWRAAARYRAGDFAGALELLESPDTADDHYNRGNVLTRLGRYQEAIAAYDQSLALNAENDDARHNRDLLRKLMQLTAGQSQGGGDAQSDPDGQSPQQGTEGRKPEPGENDSSAGGVQKEQDRNEQHAGSDTAQKLDELLAERQQQQPADGTRDAQEEKPENGAEETAAENRPDKERETAQADEQWLRRIPDDPGGLLRRKFQLQYSQSGAGAPSETPW